MKARSRSQNGNFYEFAAALIVLISFIVVPLLTIGFIPMRFMLSHGVMSDLTYRLSHCESRTDAYTLLNKDKRWKDLLSKFGVTVSGEQLSLIATTSDGGARVVVQQGQQLSPEWLPGGAQGSLIYSLELRAQCSIAPLFHGNAAVPGLTQPVTLVLSTRSQWENVSRDPKSASFFINL